MQLIQSLKPLLLLVVLLSIIILLGSNTLVAFNINNYVLLASNWLFFALNVGAFLIQLQAVKNKNPNVYFRSMMTSMLLKMVTTIGVLLSIILTNKELLGKRTLFVVMLLYIIYLTVEVKMASKLNKQKDA
jgi:hypothetical protein